MYASLCSATCASVCAPLWLALTWSLGTWLSFLGIGEEVGLVGLGFWGVGRGQGLAGLGRHRGASPGPGRVVRRAFLARRARMDCLLAWRLGRAGFLGVGLRGGLARLGSGSRLGLFAELDTRDTGGLAGCLWTGGPLARGRDCLALPRALKGLAVGSWPCSEQTP